MTFLGIVTTMLLLVLVVKNVLTDCPKSECGCTEACVDGSNRWCRNRRDPKCSCKRGCLIYNKLLKPGESKRVYCNICSCPEDPEKYQSFCTLMPWCFPDPFVRGVDYPKWWPTNPNCPV